MGELNNLLLYPNLKDKSTNYQIYADFINSSIFEIGNNSDIQDKIPTNNSEFSSYKTKSTYLYLPDGLNNEKYLLVNIVTTKNTRIELLSTFYNYLDSFIPNPIVPQLFIVKNNKLLSFDFQNEKDLKTNLVSIKGNAEIYWDNNPNKYYLQGEEDRLSLTSLKDNNKKIIVKAYSENEILKSDNDDLGFIFYLTYTLKNEKNIDEFIIGKSINFIYLENDFPIILYSKLENNNKDIYIYFTFYEIENQNNNDISNKVPIKASVSLVKEKIIYDIKSNIETSIDYSNSVQFIYDSALKSGFIRLTKEQIKKFNIEQSDRPNIYIKIDKLNEAQIFKRLNLEITANQEDLLSPLNEKVYQYGVLLKNENKKEYKLKPDLKKNYLLIEFSTLNDSVLFNLTDEKEDKLYEKVLEKNKNGKNIYIFKKNSDLNEYIKLIIYKNTNKKNKEYFTFKYYGIEDDKQYKEYLIDNDEINVERKKSKNGINYKIELNPITNSENLKVNYMVKIVNNGNKNIPKQSIVVSEEDKQFIKEFKNISPINGKITLEVNDIEGLPTYIQVVAQINDKNINEFLSYKYYELPQDEPKDESNSSLVIIIVIILIILLVIILITAIFIIKRKKNKNLFDDASYFIMGNKSKR